MTPVRKQSISQGSWILGSAVLLLAALAVILLIGWLTVLPVPPGIGRAMAVYVLVYMGLGLGLALAVDRLADFRRPKDPAA